MKVDVEEARKWDHECRIKNETIRHLINFGIIFMCHYFIISNGYLFYFIPLILSLISTGVDWYSNWSLYYQFEESVDEAEDTFSITPTINTDTWIDVSFALAILTYLILLTNTFLINLF